MHSYQSAYRVGAGATLNVEFGFIPDWLVVTNVSDRNIIHEGPLNAILAFDSGGGDGLELKGGERIQGATSKATAVIREVLLSSGTWEGGTAAGFLVLSLEEDVDGTFSDNENIQVAPQKGSSYAPGSYAGNYADVNGSALATGIEIAAAVAAGGGTDTIEPYFGEQGAKALGVSLGAGIAVNGKLLHIAAFREGVG